MMTALIEEAVIRFLSDTLETEHVYAERPTVPPEEYYLVELTSSGERNHIQTAMVAVQSISERSMLRAAQMSREAIRALRDIITLPDVCRCRLNSAYNYTDTETKQYRYQAVFDFVYMEGE